MARRVFFSFHFERDVWRANQVRNSNVVAGVDQAGFFDHSEYENAKAQGKAAIERLIREKINGTSVTVVLVGLETAARDYVAYEIAQSIANKNGLLAVTISHLKNANGTTDLQGPLPAVPWDTELPSYGWDGDLNRFAAAIQAAGLRSDTLRKK